MTQIELNRAVAQATGESVDCIARLGFNYKPAPVTIPWRWLRGRGRRLRSNAKSHSPKTAASSPASGN